MRSYPSLSMLVMVLTSGPMPAQECPTVIEVPLSTRQEWFELPGFPADPARPNFLPTFAAVPFVRYLDPDTGEPYVTGPPELQCDPADVRHAFILERDEFLLGEPIIVEFRVWLEGPGEWQDGCGGNFCLRERNDDFLFFMRHESGMWAPELLPAVCGCEGGLCGRLPVTKEESLTLRFALQSWCAFTQPGTYDIYCIKNEIFGRYGDGVGYREAVRDAGVPETYFDDSPGPKESADEPQYDLEGTRPEPITSPLAKRMPEEIREVEMHGLEAYGSPRMKESRKWQIREYVDWAHVFAHGRIHIRLGSPNERAVMVSAYMARAGDPSQWKLGDRSEAERAGICMSLQPDFLPAVETWLESAKESWGAREVLQALLANPDLRATRILLAQGETGLDIAFSMFPQVRWPHVMPNLIELLTDADEEIRKLSHKLLRVFSGGYFADDDEKKPGPELTNDTTAREIQRLWRNWWSRHASGFIPYESRSGWGYVDHYGSFVLPPQWDEAGRFENGCAAVACQDARFHISHSGIEVPPDTVRPRNEVLNWFEVGGRWGCRDAYGNEVIPPKYENPSFFSEGLAVVVEHGRYGAIDENGREVFRLEQGSIGHFKEGLAVYTLSDDAEGYVDMTGEVVIRPCYVAADSFSEGLAVVGNDSDPNDWRTELTYGYIDTCGAPVIEPCYASAKPFSEGLAAVGIDISSEDWDSDVRYGYIDRHGEMAIPVQFTEVREFKGGLAAVEIEASGQRRWGVVDLSGDWVIPAEFVYVGEFSEGVANVTMQIGSEWTTGFMDREGNWVIEPKFVEAYSFSEGLAAVSVGSPFMRFDPKEYADEAQAAR